MSRRGTAVRVVAAAVVLTAGLVVRTGTPAGASPSGHAGQGRPTSQASGPGRTFGPVSGLHVRVEGTAVTGYRAVIYDGATFVTGRGMAGPWDLTVVPKANGRQRAVHLQNRYTKFSYSPTSKTLALSGAVNTVAGTTVSRSERYRFVGSETIAATVRIRANKAAAAWYSPYTDFPSSWKPMWAGGVARHYTSPRTDDNDRDSPVPVLGESDGHYIYGMASGATWDYPVPGYNTPHLVINGNRLAAPQMGTEAHPIELSPGVPARWETVFFRSKPSLYEMELGGEVAMARALGFTRANSPGSTGPVPAGPVGLSPTPAERQGAVEDLGLVMRATAYWSREAPGGTGHAVAPSPHYAPGTYMRDSFWTTLALAGTPLFASTEEAVFNAFTAAVPTRGPEAGHVPVTVKGARFPDESGLLYLVRLYDDAVVHHLPVEDRKVAKLVLHYVRAHQVRDGAWLTAAPKKYGKFRISPDTWLDGYLYPQGAVSGYAQGLYVVALEAARQLGLGVGQAAVNRADAVYRSLYDPKLGYMRWLSNTTYKGPDVLVGDALSLLLFGRPLLPGAEVASTLAHQYWTPYGMADLATKNNTFLPKGDFNTIELDSAGHPIAVGETGGWYQNGGSWFLYAYLAEWAAARQGDKQAGAMMARSMDDEVAITPMSKEFALTSTARGRYSFPPGSSPFQRQGYGWNAAYLAFAEALPRPARPMERGPMERTALERGGPAARPGRTADYYGPASGMHVVVTGRRSTGLAAEIVDGHTLVTRRGMVGPADITVMTSTGPVQLLNRYTSAKYDRRTATLTLAGAANTVAGTRLARWESYRFVGHEVIEAKIGVSASGRRPVKFFYSPYTDFPSGWKMLRPVAGGYAPDYEFTRSYSSPLTGSNPTTQYGLPLLGAYAGRHIYGVASGDTWQYPINGYGDPHLTVEGHRLGAPQVGDAGHPIVLAPGQSRQWMQVFYRSAPTAYAFELKGEVAMAHALGYTARSSPGVNGRLDPGEFASAPLSAPKAARRAMRDWGLVLDATAYWDLQTTAGGARTVVPSNVYAPRTFMRDSFWSLLGLGGELGNKAEEYTMKLFSSHIARTGPSAGVVPTSVLPPGHPGYGLVGSHGPPAAVDESNLLYVIRMYYDVAVRHVPGVLRKRDAALALQWVVKHRVHHGRVVQISTRSGSWLDTAYTPVGSVDAYTEGLYVVALLAAKGLGLPVSDREVSAARTAYAALYRPSLGYLPWDSAPGYRYRSPDVLAGEAWALFLFNASILPTAVVKNTLRALATTPYGVKDVAAPDGSYLDNTDPRVLLQGIHNLDAPGGYQNGGDWYLFDYWAAYAGERLRIPGSGALVSWDTGRQVAVDPTSHEYLLTKPPVSEASGKGRAGKRLAAISPAAGQSPMAAPYYRQGYGWNAAFNAFDPTTARPVTTVSQALAALDSNAAHAPPSPTGPAGAKAAAQAPPSPTGPAGASAVVSVNIAHSIGTVRKAVFGQDFGWEFDGMGTFDPASGHFFANFVHQLTAVVHPGSLRYPGGIETDVFHWERAVGPERQRAPNAYGPSSGPSASAVGPAEFGALLDKTGAAGVITVNFGTGTAREAAAFVSYMTGAAGTSKWADMRAKEGHPKPYNVPWWGVGNEADQPSELYWRGGALVHIGGPPGACRSRSVPTCLYIYGGSTRFTRQAVVGYADRRPQASFSTGKRGQSFYAAYPPVLGSSATVYVGGSAWREVTSLQAAGPHAHVYTLDPGTGRITFGGGGQGAAPPAGARVTLSYVSGPHDGFAQFYKEMKSANPSIKVCSSDASKAFVEAMGSTLPYDCLQDDSYASTGTVANDAPIATYERDLMAAPARLAQREAALEAAAAYHAGHAVPLVETEYGQLLNSSPNGHPYFHDSLDEALLNASQLIDWIRLGLPVADHELAAAEVPPPTRCCAKLPGAAPYATTGAIATPGPGTVLEATGELYRLFANLAGGDVVPAAALHNPVLANVDGQPVGTLAVLAVRKGRALYLVGVNRSPNEAVTARLALYSGLALDGSAMPRGGTVTRLDGPSALSHNTRTAPRAVRLTQSKLTEAGRQMAVRFPAHSVTALRLLLARARA